MSITPEELSSAYRTLFDRAPEDEMLAEATLSFFNDAQELRTALLSSSEGRDRMYEFVFNNSPLWLRLETKFGRKIYVSTADRAVSKSILLNRSWEPEVARGLFTVLRPDSVFVDIGANIGWFTLLVGDFIEKAGGSGKIIAVEANPTVLPYLATSVVDSGLSNIVDIKPYAVSDVTGLVEVNAMKSGNLGGIGMGRLHDEATDCYVVPSVRLDDILRSETQIDVIKIDIEGAEYLALRGAESLLRKHRPSIVAELNGTALQAVSGVQANVFVNYLFELGYKAFDFRANNPESLSAENIENIVATKEYYDLLFQAD